MKEKIGTILVLVSVLLSLILSTMVCNAYGIIGWAFSFIFASTACLERHERLKKEV